MYVPSQYIVLHFRLVISPSDESAWGGPRAVNEWYLGGRMTRPTNWSIISCDSQNSTRADLRFGDHSAQSNRVDQMRYYTVRLSDFLVVKSGIVRGEVRECCGRCEPCGASQFQTFRTQCKWIYTSSTSTLVTVWSTRYKSFASEFSRSPTSAGVTESCNRLHGLLLEWVGEVRAEMHSAQRVCNNLTGTRTCQPVVNWYISARRGTPEKRNLTLDSYRTWGDVSGIRRSASCNWSTEMHVLRAEMMKLFTKSNRNISLPNTVSKVSNNLVEDGGKGNKTIRRRSN